MATRLDVLLVQRGLAPSRSRARSLVEAGVVQVAGARAGKPGMTCDEQAAIALAGCDHPYVSRGGLKLQGALEDLQLNPTGAVVADIGASTGGFTDCLLQCGASRVYAIDVGRAQLHPRLRADERVISMEGTNARHLRGGALPEAVDWAVVDASFISLTKLLRPVRELLREAGQVLALVKPQFEVGASNVGKRGVVRLESIRKQALSTVERAALTLEFELLGSVESRVSGPAGNREIFLHLRRADL